MSGHYLPADPDHAGLLQPRRQLRRLLRLDAAVVHHGVRRLQRFDERLVPLVQLQRCDRVRHLDHPAHHPRLGVDGRQHALHAIFLFEDCSEIFCVFGVAPRRGRPSGV